LGSLSITTGVAPPQGPQASLTSRITRSRRRP
jgi:hypothetical protein